MKKLLTILLLLTCGICNGQNLVQNWSFENLLINHHSQIANIRIEWSALRKEIDAIKNKKKGGCFIATATMGNYNHPVVIDLRLFRDNWLLKRNWGANFTIWYYTHGPKVARVIEGSILLKKLTFIFIIKPLQLLTKKLR